MSSIKVIKVRKGQAPAPLARDSFSLRFRDSYVDPAFRAEDAAIARLEEIAWQAYIEGRKAPITRKAGPGYADPTYDLSADWLVTKERLDSAQKVWADPKTKTRALVICASPRNDGSCPGEISKSFRLAGMVSEELAATGIEIDFLDLSLVTSDYGRTIHPCKGCVSTAMPLCNWPCSCYPNHALSQTHDWMAEIYERWVLAHAVVIVTPVHWYQSPSPLKLMIDRLVCADGGNPDPTSTQGKDPAKAKALEMKGWDYPKHLDKRASASSCTATWLASKVRAAHFPTGSTGSVSSTPACRPGSTASSATTSPTPPATTCSTATRRCRKRRATSDAPWRV